MSDASFIDTQQRVLRIVAKVSAAAFTRGGVAVDQDLRDGLGLDSITLISIFFRLEKEFDVDVSEHGDDIARLRTIGDIARFFHRVARRE